MIFARSKSDTADDFYFEIRLRVIFACSKSDTADDFYFEIRLRVIFACSKSDTADDFFEKINWQNPRKKLPGLRLFDFSQKCWRFYFYVLVANHFFLVENHFFIKQICKNS